MGIWGTLTGQDAADASRRASQDTYQKQIAAGEQANAGYQNVAGAYDPYTATGLMGNNALQNLINNPDYVQNLPGYKFALEQGLRGVDQGADAAGMYKSGARDKARMRFNQGLAMQQYGNEFNRLQGLAQFGMGATGARAGVLGAGLNAQYNSAMGGAPTVGQGEVAGEQAKQTALSQNFIQPLAYGAGSYLGGSKFKNPFGSSPNPYPNTSNAV